MSEPTTTTADVSDVPDTPDTSTNAEKAAAADAYVELMSTKLRESTTAHKDNFISMRTEETDVTLQLCEEICERLGMLARHYNIPYTEFFPLQACDLIMPKWQVSAPELKEFIEEGEAKAQLDARYEAEAEA